MDLTLFSIIFVACISPAMLIFPKLRNDQRIIGGYPVQPHSVPYIVYYLATNETRGGGCGGCILNEDTILTAAHCAWSRAKVTAGDHYRDILEPTEQVIQVSEHFIHPLYDKDMKKFDLAIAKLATPLSFNEQVQPIALPAGDEYVPGPVHAYGWGLNGSHVAVNELYGVDLNVLSIAECKKSGGPNFNENYMMCAKGAGVDSTYLGDSGGPLVKTDFSTPILIGVSSFVYNKKSNPSPNFTSLFARVGAALDFINAHM